MKKNEKNEKSGKKDSIFKTLIKNRERWVYLLIYGVISIALVILYYSNLSKKMIDSGITLNSNYKSYFLILSLILCFVINIFIFIINKRKKEIKFHKLFAISSLILGGIYLLLAPLFTGSDEHNHYYRIYEIANGTLVTPTNEVIGSKLPTSLYKTFVDTDSDPINRNARVKYKNIVTMSKIPLNKNEIEQYGKGFEKEYNNTALYSPIQYLPQVLGMKIGIIFNLNPFFIGMLARVFNLISYIIIGAWAFYKLPKFKTFSFILMTSPMILSNATTLSADAFTNIIIFLFISYIMYFIDTSKKIKKIDYVTLLILSVFIAGCKIVYLPIITLLLLIPKKSFSSKKQKYIFSFSSIILASVISLMWMNNTNQYFEIYYTATATQKTHILNNLLGYAIVVMRSYSQQFINLVSNTLAGTYMYSAQLEVYEIISFVYIGIALLSALTEKEESKISTVSKIFVGCIGIIIVALISTAIYIQCTANVVQIDNPTIVGLQGRYFIPVLMLVMLIIKNYNLNIKDKNLICMSLFMNLPIFLTMIVRFML